jgi:hypothetical protein
MRARRSGTIQRVGVRAVGLFETPEGREVLDGRQAITS